MKPLFGVFPVPEAARQDAVIEQVLLADRLGLDLVGIQDHPYQRRHLDAWTLLSYLAGRTERVSFSPTSPTCRCATRACSPSRPPRSTA